MKLQIGENSQHDHHQVHDVSTSVSTPHQPTYLPAVQSCISVQPDTSTGECGMCNHDNIQPETNFTGIPFSEHVISIPLDIEDVTG